MKRKYIGATIFIILLVAGGLFVYYKLDYQNGLDYVNVSISMKYDEKFIKTGFQVTGNETILGNTTKGYELIKVPIGINHIKNINIEDQNYYQIITEYNITENSRIDIILEKAEIPKIDVSQKENLIIEVESDNFKGLKVCVKSSVNYMFVEPINFTKIDRLDNFGLYDSCYESGLDINGKYIFEISYLEFSEPTEIDYINISLIDIDGNYKIERLK